MSRDEMWGTSDARLGCQERRAVQLRELRGAGSKGSSVAADPADCGQGAGGAVAGIRKAVRQTRPALDSAGETASLRPMNLLAMSPSIRRSRFLVNTGGLQSTVERPAT